MQGAEAEVNEEEEHTMSQPDQGKANTFQIVGTTVNNSEEKRPYVLEEYFVSSTITYSKVIHDT